MKTARNYLILVAMIAGFCSCDHSNFPSGPEEDVFTVDTIDCTGYDVPAGAITVFKAVQIGKALGNGGTTSQEYYIKGLVKSFDKKHIEAMADHHNAIFYMGDSKTSTIEFEGYQVMGLNGEPLTSLDQVQIGDFVVIKGKITNYNGTIETKGGSSASFYSSSNPLLYPEKDVAYFTETFEGGLGNWVQNTITDPGITIWTPFTSGAGVPSAMAYGTDSESVKHTGEVWLTSPAIDLASHNPGSAKLAFQTYYMAGETSPLATEQLRLKVSKDGSTWTDFAIPNFNNGRVARWAADTFDISAYVSANTRIAFAYKSTNTFAPKWYINSISIFERKHAR